MQCRACYSGRPSVLAATDRPTGSPRTDSSIDRGDSPPDPPAYVPRTGWPAWAVLPAGARRSSPVLPARRRAWHRSAIWCGRCGGASRPAGAAGVTAAIVARWACRSVSIVLATLLRFAGFFGDQPCRCAGAGPPRGGWRVYVRRCIGMFGWSRCMRPVVDASVVQAVYGRSAAVHGPHAGGLACWRCSSSASARRCRRSCCFAASCSRGWPSRGSGWSEHAAF